MSNATEVQNPFVEETNQAPAGDLELVASDLADTAVGGEVERQEVAAETTPDPGLRTRSEIIAAVQELQDEHRKLRAAVTKLHERVLQLERAPSSARARYERSEIPPAIHQQVKSLPGFAHCSGLAKLEPGHKCNQHGRAGNDQGVCPVAYTAGKMLQQGVKLEIVQARFAPQSEG